MMRGKQMRRMEFVLWAMLAAACATPVFSQTAQGGSQAPDLSGIWAHPYLTGFEPPASGPGPVKNRSRRADGIANFQQLAGDYTNPILKPEAAEIVKQHGELSINGVGY